MTRPGVDECTVAIFCGGVGLRMGRLGRGYAKTVLPVHDTPLLWRLLEQLQAAGFDQIVAATTPRFERQVTEAVECYPRELIHTNSRLEVVVSEGQRRGILVGLGELLDRLSTARCFMCLGDIFFLSNPFPPFRAELPSDYDCLGIASVTLGAELRQGGLVYQVDGQVNSIVERPPANITGQPARWSGLALMNCARAAAGLRAFLPSAPADSPAGDFFEFQRAHGYDIRGIWGPDFINVNSPDHLLLASLYAKLEKASAADALSTILAQGAESLRRDLANQPRWSSDQPDT